VGIGVSVAGVSLEGACSLDTLVKDVLADSSEEHSNGSGVSILVCIWYGLCSSMELVVAREASSSEDSAWCSLCEPKIEPVSFVVEPGGG
jgi:hypothetical protein